MADAGGAADDGAVADDVGADADAAAEEVDVDSAAAAGGAEVVSLAPPLVSADAAAGFAASDEADFFPESRKSVTYQPVPLRAKPAAVSCFTRRGWPHSGQSRSGASESFCRASF